jgi:hypothetical protein
MKTTNSPLKNSMRHWLPRITSLLRRSPATVGRRWACRAVVPRRRDEGGSLITVLLLALTCFGLSPTAQALLPAPPPDGGYPNGNTAEGTGALFSLTTGSNNAAAGFRALYSNTAGVNNTATGSQALVNNTTGGQNTANGYVALSSNTSGASNTATGSGALHGNTTASHNTATGYISLYNNTTGSFNVADGDRALYSNTTGTQNTATGYQALNSNTTSPYNTATGYQALFSNTTVGFNTANGAKALYSNTEGGQNTATGFLALSSNTTGGNNTASGNFALGSNTTGRDNTATGLGALSGNTTGNYNTASGENALQSTTGDFNTANGYAALQSNTTGIDNTAGGSFALPNSATGSDNIGIGYGAGFNVRTASNVIAIGSSLTAADVSGTTWISGIYGVTTQSGTALPVYVSNTGQLGTAASSERFKKDIKPMEQNSQAILQLKPVTFHYKTDTEAVPQFGLIAEEVEKINPDLIVKDKEGKVFAVRYEAVNAMLLNEFLKEHRRVQELESTVAKQEASTAQQRKDFQATAVQQQEEIKALTASLKEQALQIQKVSAQLEMSKAAPQTAFNNK